MSDAPAPPARLFGPDRHEITDLASWFEHAPPEKGEAQFKDGSSAKESAKAWLRTGEPRLPAEVWAVVEPVVGAVDAVNARPEHRTDLDGLGRARRHDVFACLRQGEQTVAVVGIEATAAGDFGGRVRDRAAAAPPSRKRERCNLLARALFGRDVFDESTGQVLDEALGEHGHQLWTAAVGTLIEAQQRSVDDAILLVHQFRPSDPAAGLGDGDARNWPKALAATRAAFDAFRLALEDAGGRSFETPHVRAGTRLHVLRAEALIG